MTIGADFTLTLFTNDPFLAGLGDRAGVNRIGLDLEQLDKASRQRHLKNPMLSDHALEDIPALRRVLKKAALFARTDPINPGSRAQIDRLIQEGVVVLMLPMFRTVDEVKEFVDLVDGRAYTVLLAETAAAVFRIDAVSAVPGVDEIHIGLNDLRLDARMPNHFEILTSSVMESVSAAVRGAGLRFGFGGLAQVGDATLPIPADLIYAQYARLKGQAALLTRAFIRANPGRETLAADVSRARARLDYWAAQDQDELARQRVNLARAVKNVEL